MNFAADPGLFQIYLDILGRIYLLALRAIGDFFAPLFGQADRHQLIARNHLGAGGGRTRIDCLGDHSLRCVNPGNPSQGGGR